MVAYKSSTFKLKGVFGQDASKLYCQIWIFFTFINVKDISLLSALYFKGFQKLFGLKPGRLKFQSVYCELYNTNSFHICRRYKQVKNLIISILLRR